VNARHAILALALAAPVLAAPDGPAVEVEQPTRGSAIPRATFDVRARIVADGAITAEVVWPRSRGREEIKPMSLLEDGRWGADAIPTRVGDEAFVRVRDARGNETRVPLEVSDATGWRDGPCVMAAGTPLQPRTVRDVDGVERTLAPAQGRQLVFFYGTWDAMDLDLAFLRRLRELFPDLQIIGVGSVPAESVAAWRAQLAERQVAWPNVVDADDAIGKAFELGARKAAGNAAEGVVMYYLVDGAVRGGDYVAADSLLDKGEPASFVSTVEALRGR
jgi:hypothetical protein